MNNLRRFLIGLFSSSAVVGFSIIYYYCYQIIDYAPDGLSFGNSLAVLAIVLRLFIPMSLGVIFINYAFLIYDLPRIKNNLPIRYFWFFLVFIAGFIVVLFVNFHLNEGHITNESWWVFLGQGVIVTVISGFLWLGLVHFPVSTLGRNALLPTAPSNSLKKYRAYQAFNLIAVILAFFIGYLILYALIGWSSFNSFINNNMEVAGFRKSNVDLFLKKSGEEIVNLSCAGCDKKLSGLSKVNKNKSDAEFTAILSHADILWSTGDKHYIGFCNKGEHVYAELPKDSYNVSYAHSQTRVAESMPCLKTEGEGGHPAPPLTAPPADAPKPVVDILKPVTDTPVVDKQPTIVINNYNVPVQSISGLMPQQHKPKPPASTPPKRSMRRCYDESPHP